MIYQLKKIRSKVTPVIFMLSLVFLFNSSVVGAITIGQIDDFEDGTFHGWQMGAAVPINSHLANIADGGPTGIGDNYLQVSSNGSFTAGGRLTVFNSLQWTGDYIGKGITTIVMNLNNFSSSESLNLRLAINGGVTDHLGIVTGGLFSTQTSVSLDSGSGWTQVSFSLRPDNLDAVSRLGFTTGNDVFATLANVTELRLINGNVPSWTGDPVTATIGIDNISAVPLPAAVFLFISGMTGLCTLQLGRQFKRG